MTDFRHIIGLWPTAAEFGKDIGVSDISARAMFRRNSVNPRYWSKLIDAAIKRKIIVRHEDLISAAEARFSIQNSSFNSGGPIPPADASSQQLRATDSCNQPPFLEGGAP